MVKMGVGLAALGGEVVVVKNAVEEYALGNLSLKDALLQIGPTAAAAGGVMYATFGPWGLVATAVAGLAAGIYGVIKADEQLRAEALKKIFMTVLVRAYPTLPRGLGTSHRPSWTLTSQLLIIRPSSTTPKKASKKPHLRSTD